jgi:hypothetical protein
MTDKAIEADDMDRMVKIEKLIADMQAVRDQFGNTCVYIRRGGLSWGAVALNRRADDERHGVFDLQAQHDRDMEARVGQVERLIEDRNEQRQRATEAEDRATTAQARIERLEAALREMVEEKRDYMRINNLGDPETQHSIIRARAALKGETE